ncbi:uncharacterized protein BT62DRAFT_901189 [Guyanagaster necrorhizus]|uniref:Uncharacterized protein n=1 Tax=Guyanagaster necrorhizus TaxID=856835 RepID=A0A9P8AQC0_9AGAR|nr:uncharacterized protein BT62DRAFT_901189 [Guyanagaster necrorhizus MCA 3950]KAG7443944.1 hypothetical protein BT62DRAFT_901189 [Guyanagaster necrorhizus MCA 3950]
MWLKKLFSEQKPTWTFYAYDNIAHVDLKSENNIAQNVKINIFLQSFNTKK